jgi:hypothetical protein
LCSQDEDYIVAIRNLQERCIKSGYDQEIVDGILQEAVNIPRSLRKKPKTIENESCKIRWVTLAHSNAEEEIEEFVKSTNASLQSQNIGFELIKTTAPTLGKLLFNNNGSAMNSSSTCRPSCHICSHNARGSPKKVVSTRTKEKYDIDERTTCDDSGIYLITCDCKEQYVGKTTVTFKQRFKEHGMKNTAVQRNHQSNI